MEDLSEEEKKIFANASLENLFYSASAAQKRHEEISKSRTISARLEPFVSAIDQYAIALDIAKAFEKYFKKLIDMFTRIGDVLPRCRAYYSLFPNHERLLQAISMAYLDIIHFCTDAKATFRRLKKSTTIQFTLKLIWKDFNKEFDEAMSNFRNHIKSVEKEAGLSNMIEASDERSLARADRAEKERQRKTAWRDRDLGDPNQAIRGLDDERLLVLSLVLWNTSNLIDTIAETTDRRDITKGFASLHIIERNITSQETAIAYFYCDFSDSKSLETCNILGAIAKQLLDNIAIPDELEEQIYSSYRMGGRTPTDDELVAIITSISKQFSKVFIFIDGLDECGKEEQSTILSMVHQMSRSHSPTVKILITSREEVVISESLKGLPRLQVSAENIFSDITSFVEETVKWKIKSGALVIQDLSLESDIISTLVDGAQGMFLWVHFQLADLCEAASDFGIRETLRNLPKGMAATYARIQQKIGRSPTDMALAQRIFKWIVCAKRPLLLAELAEAVSFEPTDRSWDADKIPNHSRLIQACRNLVVFDEDDETVRLAHHTVQQFLLQPPANGLARGFHFQLEQADVEVGEICVAYLSFSDFERQIAVSNPENLLPISAVPGPAAILDRATSALGLRGVPASMFKIGHILCSGSTRYQLPNFDLGKFAKLRKPPSADLHEKYHLLDYAVKNWVGHTSNFTEDNTTMWKKFKYLAMDKPMPFDVRIWGDSSVSGDLPYMALFNWAIDAGHVPLLKLLPQLPTGFDLHAYCRQSSEKGRSAVFNASRRGHANLIEFLASHACIDGEDGNPLVGAAENGHDVVVRVLLKYKLCLEGRTKAVQIASGSGHATVIRVLLKNEPPIDLQSGWGKAALAEATEKGFGEVLAVLLSKAADFELAILNLEKAWDNVALHAACGRGFSGVVRLLLEHKADVNAKEFSSGETALHLAAEKGHKAV
ncbi:hypothetical protein GP486_005756, partial [Trichoglossum hirsutum]